MDTKQLKTHMKYAKITKEDLATLQRHATYLREKLHLLDAHTPSNDRFKLLIACCEIRTDKVQDILDKVEQEQADLEYKIEYAMDELATDNL